MQATVERNRETGEFSCVANGKTLLKGKIASGIKRVHDMVDAINAGHAPQLTWGGAAENRRFVVQIGDFVVFSGDGSIKAYKELDKLEAALPPVVEIRSTDTGASVFNASAKSEMPAVPVPDPRHDQLQKLEEQDRERGAIPPPFETIDGSGGEMEQ